MARREAEKAVRSWLAIVVVACGCLCAAALAAEQAAAPQTADERIAALERRVAALEAARNRATPDDGTYLIVEGGGRPLGYIALNPGGELIIGGTWRVAQRSLWLTIGPGTQGGKFDPAAPGVWIGTLKWAGRAGPVTLVKQANSQGSAR